MTFSSSQKIDQVSMPQRFRWVLFILLLVTVVIMFVAVRFTSGIPLQHLGKSFRVMVFAGYDFTNTSVNPTQDKTYSTSYPSIRNSSITAQEVKNIQPENDLISNYRLRIAILIPSTTRSIKNVSLKTFSLTSRCIPSIKATAEHIYDYLVYVGTEKTDFLAGHADTIQAMSSSNIKIKLLIVNGGTFVNVSNEIAAKAFADGANYFVHINDDTKFITANWTSLGISTLIGYNPPNVGVVGPTCNQGNTHIMTHDMVHRTHLKIFEYYYPKEFENWWVDKWITFVYMPDRSTKLKTWEVIHTQQQGTRYKVNKDTQKRLGLMDGDKKKILQYINATRHTI